ncbi:MAG: hypothetical protein SH820_02670 [Xanthomonadales bacterium]|nr:hypothetical protein [Xanthomonadales bacterium]
MGPCLASAADSPLLLQIQSSALAGDLRPVNQLIEELDEATLDPLSLVLLQQYRDRFVQQSEAIGTANEASFAIEVITVYQDYWRSALTRTLSLEEAEHRLQDELRKLLRSGDSEFDDSEKIFDQLENALAQFDLGSSAGFTPPLRDLYIWSGQQTRPFQVELTDGKEQVTVAFIEQPLVQGWQHYASLDLVATSGWATDKGLFCLCWSYDLDSEAFRVSWLKHETRHLVDFREFPGIAESQMEYRAKLTELAFYGNAVSGLLRNFANNGSADSTSAHAQANYQVSRDIYREVFQQEMPEHLDAWQLLGPDRVAPAARRLLQRHTETLRGVQIIATGRSSCSAK